MFENDFFAHDSPTQGSVSARIRRANISNSGGGENLTSGTLDPIVAHHLLINSPGHRRNLLFEQYTHLGVGLVDHFYTQKFIIESSLSKTRNSQN